MKTKCLENMLSDLQRFVGFWTEIHRKNFTMFANICFFFFFIFTGMANGEDSQSPVGPSSYSTASTQLDSPAHPLYQMTITYLEKVIQPNYLTEMSAFMETPDDFINSWPDHWDDWLLYAIGFTVCASIGIAMLVAMYCICCSRCSCCCRCRCCKRKKYPDKSGFSKGPFVCCTILLFAVVAGLIVSIVPTFAQNNQVNSVLKTDLWVSLNTSIDTAYSYLTDSVEDINDVLYNGYVSTETQVFGILYAVPKDVLYALESATGLGTAVREAVSFAQDLPDLQSNLTEADSLTSSLQYQQTMLEYNITALVSEIRNSSSCVSDAPPSVCDEVKDIRVIVDFYAINLTAAVYAVNDAVDNGFAQLIANMTVQVSELVSDVNESIIPAIDAAASQSFAAKQQMLDLVTSFNTSVTSIQVDEAKEKIVAIQNDELYGQIVALIYWTVLVMLILLAVINALFFVGLILGVFLPFETQYSMWCCSKTCSKGFLYSGTILIFLTYWLYMAVLVVLFVAGGLVHTEACRHVTRIEKAESFAVLSMFDNWMNQSLYYKTGYNIPILPFDTIRLCHNDSSLYKALHLEEEWNMTEIEAEVEREIRGAFDSIRNTTIQLPRVDLTNPTLDQLLRQLDVAFGEHGLDFTAIFENIERNVVEPNLTQIVEHLNDANMTEYATAMKDIANAVEYMENDKEKLIYHLKIVENIVKGVPFLHIGRTFNNSEAFLNENGTEMASRMLDQTADKTEEIYLRYLDETTYSVENEVARCKEVYGALEGTTDSVCVYFLYAVNGFWFCLGSTNVFLFIGVIVSSQLIKTYRSLRESKRKSSSSQDEDEGKVTDQNAKTKAKLGSLEPKAELLVISALVSEKKLPLTARSPNKDALDITEVEIYDPIEAGTATKRPDAPGPGLPGTVAASMVEAAVVEARNDDLPTTVAVSTKVETPVYSVVSKTPAVYDNAAFEPAVDYNDELKADYHRKPVDAEPNIDYW